MNKLNYADWLSLTLLIVGGLNWGLYGIFGIDLVAIIFGDLSVLSRIVYILVGISAAYMAFGSFSLRRIDNAGEETARKPSHA